MRITPLDVRKQEFRKMMRGVDPEEVHAFLTTVADEYEAVLNDNKALRERLLELDDKVQEYRSIERTLRDTMLTAERVTVETRDNARREASLIVKEAQLQAERALRDITAEAARLRQQVQQFRSQRDAYVAKMKVVVESHLKFLEAAEREFHAEDGAIPDVIDPAREHPPRRVAPPIATTLPPATESLFDAPHTPPAPKAESTGIPGFNDILDRLSQGQREVLQSRGEPPLAAPARPSEQAPPRRRTDDASPPRAEAAQAEPKTAEEWNMEQFRRDLQNITSSLRPTDGPGR